MFEDIVCTTLLPNVETFQWHEQLAMYIVLVDNASIHQDSW